VRAAAGAAGAGAAVGVVAKGGLWAASHAAEAADLGVALVARAARAELVGGAG
jgi:hypothetical protein